MDTQELKLTQADLEKLRRLRKVCSNCGGVFIQECETHRVCEPCVKEAMEAESFNYNPKTIGEHYGI